VTTPLEVAFRIAARAAEIVMTVYTTGFDVEFKEGNDPVTRADREANEFIVGELARAFPGEPIVAEESEASTYGAWTTAPRAWFVDPLDGTREFVARNGEFGVLIGAASHGRPVLGVVICPALGRTFEATDGGNAYEIAKDGSRRVVRVSGGTTLAESRFVVSRSHKSREMESKIARLGVREVARVGSAGVKAMRVACGEAELYVHTGVAGQRWDTCGPEAIVRAAGGQVTDLEGRAIDYASGELPNARGLLVSNGTLHNAALEALQR
jgi:3'(2'), 5'-bisphosphate nucleotidase